MLRLIPAPLHRAALPLAHRVRHLWRKWRRKPLNGCLVVISNLEGAILLLRHSYGPKTWALPGGGIGPGEEPDEAALREVFEELRISLVRLESLGTMQETISGSPHTTYLYAAVTDEFPRIDKREITDARFFPLHSLPEPQGTHTRKALDIWRVRMKGA